MKRTLLWNAIIFVVVIALLSAIAIWLGLGPVVHSSV
jgi:hypothetical protein